MAILSLVLSILGLFTCITAPVGIVLGHIAKRQIHSRRGGRGLATAGLIIGYVVTGLGAATLHRHRGHRDRSRSRPATTTST